MTWLRNFFSGKDAFTNMGTRYPVANRHGETTLPGLFVAGDVSGTPDIRSAGASGAGLGSHLASLPRKDSSGDTYEVIVVGAGPAGVSVAERLAKAGVRYLVLERKEPLESLARLPKKKTLYASRKAIGDGLLDFAKDGKAGELVASWREDLSARSLNVKSGITVKTIRKHDLFQVTTNQGELFAHRVVVAVGKPAQLVKLKVKGASRPRVRYLLGEHEAIKGKKVLVLCAGSGELALERVEELYSANDVILACDHTSGAPHQPDPAVWSRAKTLAEEGKLSILGDIKLKEIRQDDLLIERQGSEETIAADLILPATPVEASLDKRELADLSVRLEQVWTAGRVASLVFAVALVAAFYHSLKAWGGTIHLGPLSGWNLYAALYSILVVIFGAKVMRDLYRRYHDAYQVKRYLSLIFFQVFFFWIIPDFVLKNWMADGLAYVFPLSLKPTNVENFIGSKSFYLAWILFTTFVLLPLFTWRKGKKYCTWICGCGALAETVGASFRHYSPKGQANTRRERQIYFVTGFAFVTTAAVLLGFDHLSAGVSLTAIYGLTVDLWLISILPIAFYPFFGGKIWCRYWCPVVGMMNLFQKAKPSFLATHGIASKRERCIACGMCDRYCEVGVPVMKHALKGSFFSADNSSCIGCGVCITVCPTEVLNFANIKQRAA